MTAQVIDKLADRPTTDNGSCTRAFVIEPSDSEDLPHTIEWIHVGRGGALCVLLEGDSEPVKFFGLRSGSALRISVRRVLLRGTSATRLVGLW